MFLFPEDRKRTKRKTDTTVRKQETAPAETTSQVTVESVRGEEGGGGVSE